LIISNSDRAGLDAAAWMRNFKGKKDLKISLIRLLAKYKCEKPNFFLFFREKRNETKEKTPR
jgi:hypothetical protein